MSYCFHMSTPWISIVNIQDYNNCPIIKVDYRNVFTVYCLMIHQGNTVPATVFMSFAANPPNLGGGECVVVSDE